MRFIVLVFACYLTLYEAAYLKTALETFVLKEKIVVPDILHKRAISHAFHTVTFEFKHRNLDLLENILMNVSSPTHNDHGKYLSREALNKLVADSVGSQKVKEYLKHNVQGVRFLESNMYEDEYLVVEASVGDWEKLFNTEFHEFEHESWEGQKIIRAAEYSLPSSIAAHVEMVTNIVRFPIAWTDGIVYNGDVAAGTFDATYSDLRNPGTYRSGYVTPASITTAYNIINPTNAIPRTSIGIFAPQGRISSSVDISMFRTNLGISSSSSITYFGTSSITNACTALGTQYAACAQLNAELQYITALAPGVPVTVYYWQSGDIVEYFQYLLNAPSVPQILVIGYTIDEALLSFSYITAFNRAAMKLTSLGVTILVSSGNDGVAGFKARYNLGTCMYNPQFPASTPYVTAVGGTIGAETFTRDVPAQGYVNGAIVSSGGGFSRVNGVPTWQATRVSSYFSQMSSGLVTTAIGGYSQGRGYPDIAAASNKFYVVLNGGHYLVHGTAMSTIVVAGMVAMMNNARLTAGMSVLGFFSPTLYTNTGAFVVDTYTYAFNRCNAGGNCCQQGFFTGHGWDPVIGLGVINYATWYYTIFGFPLLMSQLTTINTWTSTPVYSASNTLSATQNILTTSVYGCPRDYLYVSTCDVYLSGTEYYTPPQPYPAGAFTMYDASHNLVLSWSSPDTCNTLYYYVPATSTCQLYTIYAGCYGNINCYGQLYLYYIKYIPPPSAMPTVPPTFPPLPSPFTKMNTWNYCAYYSTTISTDSATQNFRYCTFYACASTTVQFSNCASDISNDGMYYNSLATCTGDTYISVLNAAGTIIYGIDDGGGCGTTCSAGALTLTDVCQQYVVRLGCYVTNICTHTLGIYMYSGSFAPPPPPPGTYYA